MKIRLFLLLSLGALSALSVQAKPYHLTSVRWIVANRNKLTYDDKYVTMIGHVTRRMGDEEYWFTDGTGSVRLDSENFDLPAGPRLMIGGRIDEAYLGFGHIEVDVRKWSYAPVHHVHPIVALAARQPVPTVIGTTMTPPSPRTWAPAPMVPPSVPAPMAPPPVSTGPPATPTMTAPETPMTNAVPTLAPPMETPATNAAVPSTVPPDSTNSSATTNAEVPMTPPPSPVSTLTNAAP